MLTITCGQDDIRMERNGATMASMPLSQQNVFLLDTVFQHLGGLGAFDGELRVIMPGKEEEMRGLRLELLLQLIALCTVYHAYPKHSEKSPFRPENSPEDFDHHLHSIENLPIFQGLPHCGKLAKLAEGRPVAVVSAGPSVDYGLLRRLKDSLYILAVGRVLPRLLRQGITPDLLYVQETTPKGWADIFGQDDGTILDTTLICNPAGPIRRFLHRVKRAFKSWNFYPQESDLLPKIEEIAPSSASGAYSIARLLGAAQILFMGCDCGEFADQKSPDFLASAHPLEGLLAGGQLPPEPFATVSWFLMDGPGGRTILTKSDYLASAQWLRTRFFRAAEAYGAPLHYDNSLTGMLRRNGLALPYPESFDFVPFAKAEPMTADTGFDPAPILKRHLSRYTYIRRHLQRGPSTPEASLQRPYNCIYKDVARYSGKPLELDDHERALVLGRVDRLIEALDEAASAIAG